MRVHPKSQRNSKRIDEKRQDAQPTVKARKKGVNIRTMLILRKLQEIKKTALNE